MLVLQGYTNYQLDRSKGTVAQVPNQAPPFMGINPNGQYRSYAGQAPPSITGLCPLLNVLLQWILLHEYLQVCEVMLTLPCHLSTLNTE